MIDLPQKSFTRSSAQKIRAELVNKGRWADAYVTSIITSDGIAVWRIVEVEETPNFWAQMIEIMVRQLYAPYS